MKIVYGMFKLKIKFILWCKVVDYYDIMKPMRVSLKIKLIISFKIFLKNYYCA